MEYIIAIGIVQALVAALLLWKGKLRHSADGLLIALVACIATHLSIKFVIFNFVNDREVRYMMNTFINFGYGPLLYLYVLKVIHPAFVPASRWYVFLPLLAGITGYFSVASVLIASPDAGHKMLYWYNTLSFWTFMPADFLFAVIAIRKATKRLTWMKKERQLIVQLAGCFLALSCMALLFYGLMLLGYEFNLLSRCIAYSVLALISVRIMVYRYAGPQQALPAAVVPVPADKVETTVHTIPQVAGIEEAPVSRRNLLSEEDMKDTWQQLEDCMQRQQVFADSELNLDKLSQIASLNKYHVSETLNRYAKKSFYQYINEYRIKRVVHQLNNFHSRDLQVNLLTLAYDAGFKSKSSFNRYFKELTGHTPSEYFKSLSGQVV